tara:strand:+ start:198 stop:512 length:315 start_codon:yes stop_codon:yes gene_type:complete
MKNIGNFLRAFEEKRIHIKLENDTVRHRLSQNNSGFSLKAFFIQLVLGIIGLLTFIYLEPLVQTFSSEGGNSPLVFWGYIIASVFIIVGSFAIFDLIKKLLGLE